MKTLIIPNDLLTDDRSDDINILSYNAFSPSSKNRISVSKNLFCFLVEGEKEVISPNKSGTVNISKILLLTSGNCLMTEKMSLTGSYQSTLLFFGDAILVDFFIKHKDLIADISKGDISIAEPFYIFQKDTFLHHFTESLNIMLQSGMPISKRMKQVKFEEIMMYLCEKSPKSIEQFYLSRIATPQELEIRLAVESHVENNITIDELAFLCNTSPSTFKRRFLKIYGESPNQWMLKKRMSIAANLLKNNHQRPSEVFHKVGYENLSSFSQAFKQTYGKTPKEFQLQTLTE